MLIVTVVHADGPSIGRQWLFEGYDWDGAVEKVIEIVQEQFGCTANADDVTKESGYVSEDGDFAVLIGMSE